VPRSPATRAAADTPRTRPRAPLALAPVAALALAVAVAGLTAGCATTRLATEWRDPALEARPMRTLFVLAAVMDPVKRRHWEDAFTDALRSRGVSATPSYRLYPETLPDSAAVRAKVREGGFDGVLFVRKHDEEEVVREGSGTSLGVGGAFTPFWGVYVSVFRRVAGSGRAETSRTVRWEVQVWEGGDAGRMVWAARTETADPAAVDRFSREVAGALVPRLRRAGLVP
jgi:hypothetical protein